MSTPSCLRPSCPVASGGRCLEGFADPATECPNWAGTVESSGPPDGEDPVEVDLVDVVPHRPRDTSTEHVYAGIHAGEALSPAEASEIARRALARVVTVAGMAGSGKSALVACAFHELLEGPFAGYAFAGSRTLPAFDERCHRARVASGRASATMERTLPGAGTRFLHLRLAAVAPGTVGPDATAQPRDLLLADVAGEGFHRARDNADDARTLTVLRRSDRLAVLVDGAQLADPSARNGAARDALALLRSLLDAGMIDRTTAVDLVVTKWDLVLAGDASTAAAAYVDSLEARAAVHARRVAELRTHRTAALPTKSTVPLGFGVDGLLRSWVESSHLIPTPGPRVTPAAPAGAREYARFAERVAAPRPARPDAPAGAEAA